MAFLLCMYAVALFSTDFGSITAETKESPMTLQYNTIFMSTPHLHELYAW